MSKHKNKKYTTVIEDDYYAYEDCPRKKKPNKHKPRENIYNIYEQLTDDSYRKKAKQK